MKNKILKLTALFFFAALFTLTSCRKEADTQSAEDAARGGYMMADAFAISNKGANDGGKALLDEFGSCNIDFDQFENGFKVTFENCTDDNGLTHNGSIIFSASGDGNTDVSYGNITITFENYTVDNEGINGTVTADFEAGKLGFWFNIGARNLTLKHADGSKVIYDKYDLKYVFALGNGFKFTISGSSEGTNRDGKHFKTESNDVVLSLFNFSNNGCSGTMTVEVEGEKPLTINYDTGECGKVEVSQKGRKNQKISLF